jgi:filamentous hemagglutinin family protein
MSRMVNARTWQGLFGVARFSRASLALAVVGAFTNFLPPASAQHIAVDGRFSPAQTLVGPNYSITANLGKQVGSNLFHSFGQFGLATGESAAFSGPATVNNIIGRVTGGSASSIDGRIQSTIAGANLYLINPSGIVFGPNATVNVSGSFHASTADYLKMSDGAKFQATNPDGSTLSAAPPAAFGFLTATPAQISVNGSTLGPVPGTLGLVGGPVSISAASPNTASGATLSAPAGTIQLTSVAGTGEVPIDPRNTRALTVTRFDPINVIGSTAIIGSGAKSSKLDVSNPNGQGTSGGSVFIRSGTLTLSNSEINADNYGSGRGGQLVIQADNQIALTNATLVHSTASGAGTGAAIIVSTAPSGSMSIDESAVQTGTLGAGTAGPISVSSGQLNITNEGEINASTIPGNGNEGSVNGNGGSVTVTAGQLSMVKGLLTPQPLETETVETLSSPSAAHLASMELLSRTPESPRAPM